MRIIALMCCALAVSPASSQTQLRLDDPRWVLTGDGTKRETIDGRDTLAIENGFAYRRDIRLLDGSVDFDVQLTPRRSFVYLQFRLASDSDHEEIYLRAHKPNLPDALQYAPVFNGVSLWQLFHGPGSTAPSRFTYGTWTHVRLVVKGTQAALFVGDMVKPALVMPSLARAAAPGYIALRVFTADAAPGPPTRFSNVEVSPGHVPFDFSSVTVPDSTEPAGKREWRVSEPYFPG